MQTNALFDRPVGQPKREAAINASMPLFDNAPRETVRQFLNLCILPPFQQWAFVSIGKSASSSTLKYLYELEFGHPFSTRFNAPIDINLSTAIHALADHGVFARALARGLSLPNLPGADVTRIAVASNAWG